MLVTLLELRYPPLAVTLGTTVWRAVIPPCLKGHCALKVITVQRGLQTILTRHVETVPTATTQVCQIFQNAYPVTRARPAQVWPSPSPMECVLLDTFAAEKPQPPVHEMVAPLVICVCLAHIALKELVNLSAVKLGLSPTQQDWLPVMAALLASTVWMERMLCAALKEGIALATTQPISRCVPQEHTILSLVSIMCSSL